MLIEFRRKVKRAWRLVPLAMLSALAATSARAQDAPPVPPPSVPGTSREAELEARLKQMEAMVEKLSKQVDQLSSAPASAKSPSDNAGGGDGGGAAMAATPSSSGGVNAPGQSLPPNPPPNARFQVPATLANKPAKVKFGPGFEIRTDDDEFVFQFHNLTQIDYRGYQQGGQNPVHDTFGIPRQWFMFSGRATKEIGYFVSIANGFDAVSALDFFVDFSYDPRFQIRAGRMKTPFTYEFLVEPIQGLLSPERSIFFNNFGQNRDVGVMLFGRLFDKKIDYAGGIFNGARNGYLSTADAKTVSGFINYKPFGGLENSVFENFNIGGSVFVENSAQGAPNPTILRTIVPTAGSTTLGVPFLAFNSNIRESGYRAFWDLHMAWFYEQLTVIAEWGSGGQQYAPSTQLSNRTRLSVDSFYVQSGYFLTGEKASSVGIVKPLSPFNIKNGGVTGWGAWELITRYQYMQLGNEVFTSGLADPNLWSNRVWITDLGVNWHINQYVKVMMDWQHSEFGNPVEFAPGKRQLTSDLFWLRLQLFF